jgi:signal recognition particle GTPase
MAMVNNPKLIQEAISNLSSKAGIELPILSSTIFIPGIGGSGKTSVVAKMIAEYAKDKKLYMAAPGES